ncbi:hypothetical protein B0T13DRAFT_505044 [Neurospora crassa]|nr:hypothetical protein B0T13DRAFT_505044 [Neurospora crassa]
MSYHELLNVIEPVEDGLFDSLINSLNSLPDSNNTAKKWWARQTEWNKWYAAYLEEFERSSLTQTVTELYTALEALTRWTQKLGNVSKFLAEGRDVEIIDVLMKGEDMEAKKTQKQLEEVEEKCTTTAAAVIEEMHMMERYLRARILPQSISLAVKAAEKDCSAPKVRQSNLAGSHGTSTAGLTQDSASTSAFLGGQAALRR